MKAAFPQLRFEFDPADPNRSFQRLLLQLNDFIATVNLNPSNYAVPVNGGAFTAAQSKELVHGLGRMPQGILSLLPEGGYSSFKLSGKTESSITIQSENAVTSSTFLVY